MQICHTVDGLPAKWSPQNVHSRLIGPPWTEYCSHTCPLPPSPPLCRGWSHSWCGIQRVFRLGFQRQAKQWHLVYQCICTCICLKLGTPVAFTLQLLMQYSPAGSRVQSGVCSMEGEDGRVTLMEKAYNFHAEKRQSANYTQRTTVKQRENCLQHCRWYQGDHLQWISINDSTLSSICYTVFYMVRVGLWLV